MSLEFPFFALSALEDVASILRYINDSILFLNWTYTDKNISFMKINITLISHSLLDILNS